MADSIEVYVRPASHGPIINIHVPRGFRESFIRAIEGKGTISSEKIPINFEMTLLQDWTDADLVEDVGPHVKVTAKDLNIIFDE